MEALNELLGGKEYFSNVDEQTARPLDFKMIDSSTVKIEFMANILADQTVLCEGVQNLEFQ